MINVLYNFTTKSLAAHLDTNGHTAHIPHTARKAQTGTRRTSRTPQPGGLFRSPVEDAPHEHTAHNTHARTRPPARSHGTQPWDMGGAPVSAVAGTRNSDGERDSTSALPKLSTKRAVSIFVKKL